MPSYVRRLENAKRPPVLSGKAKGLEALIALGVRTPRTFIVPAIAKNHFEDSRRRPRLVRRLKQELERLGPSSSGSFAVRSSAIGEDGPLRSLAGHYESYLHVQGVEQMIEAIQSVWSSGSAQSSQRMDVLIQDMIVPISSGASFSRDPVTGEDVVVVEAVEGLSERLLQGGVTPHRWRMGDQPPDSQWEKLPSDILQDIAQTTRHVAKKLHFPADLEWAFDGETLWWLQARPITTLRGLPIYSNRIAREYLPGLVKPLVWSINVPMINGAWVDLFEQIVGPLSLDPTTLARQFHYRAYFNMSGMGELLGKLGLPEDALEQVFGLVASTADSPFGFRWRMVRHLPRVLRFGCKLLVFHGRVPRWERLLMQRFANEEHALRQAKDLKGAMDWVECFLPHMRQVSRLRILSLLLHLTVGQLATRILRSNGQGDSGRLEVEDPRLEKYDPVASMHRLSKTIHELPSDERRKLERSGFDGRELDELIASEPWTTVKQELSAFVERFGYVGERGNDFSSISWSEHPISLLRVAARASGTSRQQEERSWGTRRVRRWRSRVAERRLDRERIGALSSRGFHLLRLWALRCGRFLVERGVLDAQEDVFLLSLDTLRGFADGQMNGHALAEVVRQHRSAMKRAEGQKLPETIVGDDVLLGQDVESSKSSVLRGIGTSRGIFEGRARAIRSMKEFDTLRNGDVLVVPFSDMAWTPLFARAGAVVAEAGGLLSHSSIVARETGVPAVVSVLNACELLDGKYVRVDGLQGTVAFLT